MVIPHPSGCGGPLPLGNLPTDLSLITAWALASAARPEQGTSAEQKRLVGCNAMMHHLWGAHQVKQGEWAPHWQS